jgi:DMSO/TMAO reductase YedYZ molybdopterin-dependent catalytic subunit
MQRDRRAVNVADAAQDRLPPGQVLTQKWPVLTFGDTPMVDLAGWSFRCFGLVEEPVSWSWQQFLELPRVEVTSDVHCVTRWSRFDNRWEGVAVSEILRRARVKSEATAVMVHAEQDYTTNLLLEDLQNDDVLLAIKHDGQDLPAEHGGPCRLVVPRLYFWKSAKWARGLEFIDVNAPGFWEMNGYHLRADPWREERYSAQETNAMQRMRALARPLGPRRSTPT